MDSTFVMFIIVQITFAHAIQMQYKISREEAVNQVFVNCSSSSHSSRIYLNLYEHFLFLVLRFFALLLFKCSFTLHFFFVFFILFRLFIFRLLHFLSNLINIVSNERNLAQDDLQKKTRI